MANTTSRGSIAVVKIPKVSIASNTTIRKSFRVWEITPSRCGIAKVWLVNAFWQVTRDLYYVCSTTSGSLYPAPRTRQFGFGTSLPANTLPPLFIIVRLSSIYGTYGNSIKSLSFDCVQKVRLSPKGKCFPHCYCGNFELKGRPQRGTCQLSLLFNNFCVNRMKKDTFFVSLTFVVLYTHPSWNNGSFILPKRT